MRQEDCVPNQAVGHTSAPQNDRSYPAPSNAIVSGASPMVEVTSVAITDSALTIRAEPRRVVVRPFVPEQEIRPDDGLLARILALPEQSVTEILSIAVAKFDNRHLNLTSILENHFEYVARGKNGLAEISKNRQLLIGAYFTQEFSIEAAALTNPSVVVSPDQSGLNPGELRLIISLRAIGEGHLSSIVFRSGLIDATGTLSVEAPSRYSLTGEHSPATLHKEVFCAKLAEMNACDELANLVLDQLPEDFRLHELDDVIAAVEGKQAPCRLSEPATKTMHWLATSNYQLSFDPDSKLHQRVIFPWSAIESHGLEDARFVRFTEDNGDTTYFATYTAFDGLRVLPQLIETADFCTFRIDTLSGKYAENKGAALFPRKINGLYVALSRFDSENNFLMRSDNLRVWENAAELDGPEFPWDLARIGNCGSPIETEAGWLVITHGVGPFREYSLGAMLLDLDEPTHVIGRLSKPLLVATGDEREGYVPNVVYSCGSIIHNGELILPYGLADTTSHIARVPIKELLTELVR